MTHEDRVRLRHTDRFVGALVLLAVAVFLAVAIERSVIRQFFAGGEQLVVMMPEDSGVAGLTEGSEAEVLGVRAGTVRRVVVAPEGRIRAELRIEEQVKNFIRADSVATVRRRFGVAGPAYLDISRGEGAPLDWDRNAVIEARIEQAATETAGALLDDLRNRVFPVLDDLQRGTRAFADAAERINRGEGTIGRLLSDETLVREAESAVQGVNATIATFGEAAREIRTLASALAGGDASQAGSLAAVLARADRTLATLERASADAARAAATLPRTARNIEQASTPLPGLIVQIQGTAREVERLAAQLRASWLVGGGGGPAAGERLRPSADRVRP
jgi:phospholipid/cholesterol/gamma-HCH transport system substrate-binding protein